MGFYYKNKYDTVLNFDNKGGGISDASFYSEGIQLINNENIVFDFTDYIQSYSVGDILLETDDDEIIDDNDSNLVKAELEGHLGLEIDGINAMDCLYKITIDCKDGNIITANRPTDGNSSWLIITHKPYFNNETYYNLPDNKSTWPTIDITLYNLYGSKIRNTIKIPFRLKKSSYTQSGIKLKLVAANITNDNKVAYIFNDENNNQLILAKKV